MALTNEDLQAIAGLLQTELQPVKEDISTLKQETRALREDVSTLKQETIELSQRIDNLELQTKQMEHVLRDEIRKSEYLILDEVERVHAILDKHKSDITKHTA